MRVQRLLLIVVVLWSTLAAAAAKDSEDALAVYLAGENPQAQRQAFDRILAHPEAYVPSIKQKLESLAKEQDPDSKTLTRLLYLPAILRDPAFIPPLLDLIKRPDAEIACGCIYRCPLILALTNYAVFAQWSPPKDLNKAAAELGDDLSSEIESVKNLDWENPNTKDLPSGPGVDDLLKEMSKLNAEDLIRRADTDASKDLRAQEAAAYMLEATVTTSAHLRELYWLAIRGDDSPLNDGAQEYRCAIYEAIYRAEKAKAAGK